MKIEMNMQVPRLRAWNLELKIMELPEDIFTKENIYMLLNKKDYVWMRYIEQEDINDKEIYEGDILKCIDIDTHDSHLFFVEYSDKYACFRLMRINGKRFNNVKVRCGDILPEIIGNVYENPELMENNNELSRLR